MGTPGDDVILVTADTRSIDGGAGFDTAVFGRDRDWYTIVMTATGVDVTDTHSSGITVHLKNVERIAFTGGVNYDIVAPPAAAGSLIGTAGDDVLQILPTTRFVDGGPGTDTAVFAQDQSWYSINKSASGVDVTETHASGVVVHLQSVEKLRFAGGTTYDVASGHFVGSPSPTPAPAPTPAPSPGTVIGTAGNDTITIDSSTRFVDGGAGQDTAVFAQDVSWYSIVKTATGVDVTETHASGITVHLQNVETFDFAGGNSYDVASGKLTIVPTPSPTPGPSGTPSVGIIATPVLQQPTHSGDIVAIRLDNPNAHADAAQTVSFGQVFAQGDLPAGAHLIALVNGQQVALQIDVKTTYADGSINNAVVSLQAPAIAANSSVQIMLARGTPAGAAPLMTASDILAHGYNGQLNLTFHNTDGSTTAQNIDIGNALSQAIAHGNVQYWMEGSLATEARVVVAVNPQMNATFDIRGNADGSFETGVTVNNSQAYQTAQTFNYDATITQNGKVAFSQNGISQYSYSNWHQDIFSTGAPPAVNVVHDVTYLERTGAIASYDTSSGVAQGEIAYQASLLAKSDTGILGSGLVTQYMPATGGRADIGQTTSWATEALLTQDPVAMRIMLANANVSGSVPWHLIDGATGEAVSIIDHPNLWVDARGIQSYYGNDRLPTAYNPGGGWTPDVAHEPDLTFIPYLLTGSHYYLDEVQAAASYSLAAFDPAYRGGSAGIMSGQVRAMAWGLRDAANAAYMTPAGDPLHAYFVTEVNNNLNALVTRYITNGDHSAGQLEGWLNYAADGNVLAPWQQDYFINVLGTLAHQGFAQADQLLNWMEPFMSGLYLNGANGFDPLHGPAYWLHMADSSGHPYTTWSELYQGNFGGTPPLTSIDGNPSWAGGYVANAKAGLATLITETAQPDSIEAYAYLVGLSPQLPVSYQIYPTFDITPTLPDGHHLLGSEIQVGPTGGTATLTATSPDSLLAAAGADTVLQGGSGISILHGGSGNDTLLGGAGNDYLFAGSGNDRLSAGPGINYLKGGSGSDLFVFNQMDHATDRLVHFKPGQDLLEIHANGAPLAAADLIANATSDAAGDAVLHLGAQHDIVLAGVHTTQLNAGWFHMV